MNNQTPNPSAVIAFPNKEDDLDKVGHAASDLIIKQRAEQNNRPNRFWRWPTNFRFSLEPLKID